jgi:AraC family transcriptional regulator
VLYARSAGVYAVSVAQAWHTMTLWLKARDARHLVKRGIGVFHDNPSVTAPEAQRYDACVRLGADATLDADPEAGIGHQTLAGGAYAVHSHMGAYEAMGELFSNLRTEAVAKRGLSIDDGRPFVAIYLNDPMRTREVHRHTELCIPVIPIRVPLSGNDDCDGDLAGSAEAIGRRIRA